MGRMMAVTVAVLVMAAAVWADTVRLDVRAKPGGTFGAPGASGMIVKFGKGAGDADGCWTPVVVLALNVSPSNVPIGFDPQSGIAGYGMGEDWTVTLVCLPPTGSKRTPTVYVLATGDRQFTARVTIGVNEPGFGGRARATITSKELWVWSVGTRGGPQLPRMIGDGTVVTSQGETFGGWSRQNVFVGATGNLPAHARWGFGNLGTTFGKADPATRWLPMSAAGSFEW